MNFREAVLKTVSDIPFGEVRTYGDVAAIAGSPRAARVVGGILGSLGLQESHIPWWRVVNKKGFLSIRGHDLHAKDVQKALLESEGIKVDEAYQIIFSH